MTSLFDPAINEEILTRVEKLDPATKPRWGKMSIEEMLAHLNLSLQVNWGLIELKPVFLAVFFRGIARPVLLGKKPFPKNLPADKMTLTKSVPDFSSEKLQVTTAIKMYLEKGPAGLSKNPHNILGKITPEESAFISYKHLDHHLRQFGV